MHDTRHQIPGFGGLSSDNTFANCGKTIADRSICGEIGTIVDSSSGGNTVKAFEFPGVLKGSYLKVQAA